MMKVFFGVSLMFFAVFQSCVVMADEAALVKVVSHGGDCPNGIMSEIAIYANGEYVSQDHCAGEGIKKRHLSQEVITELKRLVEKTDFIKIQSDRFEGTCPSAWDGVEESYVFYTSKGDVELSSCSVNINYDDPLFKRIRDIKTKREAI